MNVKKLSIVASLALLLCGSVFVWSSRAEETAPAAPEAPAEASSEVGTDEPPTGDVIEEVGNEASQPTDDGTVVEEGTADEGTVPAEEVPAAAKESEERSSN